MSVASFASRFRPSQTGEEQGRSYRQRGLETLRAVQQVLVKQIATRLLTTTEQATACAVLKMPKTPANVVHSYGVGWLLFGGDGDSLVWETMAERAIITPQEAHISKRLRGYMNRKEYEVRHNTCFDEVIRACQREEWTWINDSALQLYSQLHEMGFIRTVEAYKDDELVGGLWGLVIGRGFAIMSMFHRVDRAGAIALGSLIQGLAAGDYDFVDCGALKPNFVRYGAKGVSKAEFIELAARSLMPRSSHVPK